MIILGLQVFPLHVEKLLVFLHLYLHLNKTNTQKKKHSTHLYNFWIYEKTLRFITDSQAKSYYTILPVLCC